MLTTKDDLADLRGDTPALCDVCHATRSLNELEPEEAGLWVCHMCLRRWVKHDVKQIKAILAVVYSDLGAAKWWFTPQTYLGDRTPHELILIDQSEMVLLRLKRWAEGDYG